MASENVPDDDEWRGNDHDGGPLLEPSGLEGLLRRVGEQLAQSAKPKRAEEDFLDLREALGRCTGLNLVHLERRSIDVHVEGAEPVGFFADCSKDPQIMVPSSAPWKMTAAVTGDQVISRRRRGRCSGTSTSSSR
jgi:hypothetical protein